MIWRRGLDVLLDANVISVAAITGWCVFVARELGHPLGLVATASLVVWLWQIYLLDRLRPQPEDQPIAGDVARASAFVGRHRGILRVAFMISLGLQLAFVVRVPWLLVSLVLAVASVSFYIVPIPWLGLRIKQIPFAKHVYAPAAVTWFMFVFAGFPSISGARAWTVLLTMFGLTMANAIVFDLKDADRDRAAGLVLLSTVSPRRTVLRALVVGCVALALATLVLLRDATGLAIASAFVAEAVLFVALDRRFSQRLLRSAGDLVLAWPWLLAAMT